VAATTGDEPLAHSSAELPTLRSNGRLLGRTVDSSVERLITLASGRTRMDDEPAVGDGEAAERGVRERHADVDVAVGVPSEAFVDERDDAVICYPLRGTLPLAPTDELLMIEKRRGLGADLYNGPGGKVEAGETLVAAAMRETHEETGVAVDPVAPRAVDEFTFVNERTGDTAGWTLVVYEAVADSPETDRDPTVDDEEIDEIRWFDGLPDEVFNPDLIEPAYERCEQGK
jgi:8-oxo-dGTP diphosphatase